MNNSNYTGCLWCDFGDMEIMRNNGYDEDKYVYCELHNAIIDVVDDCPTCATNNIEEKRQVHIDSLFKSMAAAMEELDE